MIKNEPVYHTETVHIGNVTVNVHRPKLTEAERRKAEEFIKTALADFGKKLLRR